MPVVTGRFVTVGAEVVDLRLEYVQNPIGVTPEHPLYSLDRQGWIPARELQIGEVLRTIDGEARVESVMPRAERATVYNVEVSKYHTYFVGDVGVWAHNPCQLSQDAMKLQSQVKASNGQRSLAAFRQGNELRLGSSHSEIITHFKGTNFSSWTHGFVSWINGAWVFRHKL
jgi:hypothetical protein